MGKILREQKGTMTCSFRRSENCALEQYSVPPFPWSESATCGPFHPSAQTEVSVFLFIQLCPLKQCCANTEHHYVLWFLTEMLCTERLTFGLFWGLFTHLFNDFENVNSRKEF